MAILWMDSFDHYGAIANLTEGPYAEVHNSVMAISTTQARTGTASLQNNGTDPIGASMNGFRRVFGSALVTVGVQFAIYMEDLPDTNNELVWSFCDAANAQQITVCVDTTGALTVKRGSSAGTTLATSTGLITANSWNFLEHKVKIDDTTGTVEIRLNGTTIINITGADTKATANTETSQVRWENVTVTNTVWYIDDLVAWDTSGAINNNFLGDTRVYTLFPNADSTPEEWTRSAGSDTYALLDESTPDDDTTYIQAATVADRSQFGMQDLPTDVANVYAVQLTSAAKKTDAGASTFTHSAVSSGTVGAGAAHAVTTAYAYYQHVFETDPNTSAQWAKANVDAMEVRLTRTV